MNSNFKSFIKNNNLKLVKQIDNNNIVIPEEIYIHENETELKIIDKIDKYIEMYKLAIDIKTKFYEYTLGKEIDESNFINSLKVFNEYEYKKLLADEIQFYPDKLRDRMIKSEEWLDLDNNKINKLKLEAEKLIIQSEKNIKITNQKLDKIMEELQKSDIIDIKNDDISKYKGDSYLVMGFTTYEAAENLRLYTENDLEGRFHKIDFIYSNKESLSYIIKKNYNKNKDNRYIKFIELSNNLSKEDYNLIEAHAYVRFKPNLDINKKININRKWATYRQLRYRFNIKDDKSIENKLKNAFEKVNGLVKFDIGISVYKYSYLYDIELFKLACSRYDETENEKLGNIYYNVRR